jgi:Ca2+-binding EF-hand superfamily protein
MKDSDALRAKFEASANEKGCIDGARFPGLVRKLGLKLTDAKASNAFVALDVNGEDSVDFEAFSAWWFKYSRP